MYIKSTKVQELEKTLIKEAITKNPFITKDEIAKQVGVSTRTVYRLLNRYKIIDRKPKMSMEQKCINYLKSIGYQFD